MHYNVLSINFVTLSNILRSLHLFFSQLEKYSEKYRDILIPKMNCTSSAVKYDDKYPQLCEDIPE